MAYKPSNTLLKLLGPDEINRIKSDKIINEQWSETFKEYSNNWKDKCDSLADSILILTSSSAKEIKKKLTQAAADNFRYRADIADSIRDLSGHLAEIISENNEIDADKTLYYKTVAQVKPSDVKERNSYLSAHLRENQRRVHILEAYIEFLRGLQENFKSYDFLIKNLMEIHKMNGFE